MASQPGITADSRIEQNGKDCLSYLISICSLQEERGVPYDYTVEQRIKRSPSIKRSVFKLPKNTPLYVL